MNVVGSLNLSTRDEGVRAIANSPAALDWLAIAFPTTDFTSTSFSLPEASAPALAQPGASTFPQVANGITKKQAAVALVRHTAPYSSREVLAPCFRVSGRFVLGRTLGNLHLPAELGLPQLGADRCEDARFVVDLEYGSVVEVRQYASSRVSVCLAYAADRAEFIALPPLQPARVEITYQRDNGAGGTELGLGPLFQRGPLPIALHDAWQHFCTCYSSILPTGPVTATVTSEPGVAAVTFRRESITVTMNDPFAMSFSSLPVTSLRATGSQARRIAPKLLLPRPSI